MCPDCNKNELVERDRIRCDNCGRLIFICRAAVDKYERELAAAKERVRIYVPKDTTESGLVLAGR